MTEDIQALRDALAARPTPGKWVAHTPSLIVRTTGRLYVASVQLDEEDPEAVATLHYIAACSPDRIARLLDALEAARDALDEIGNDEDCWTAEGMRMIARDALAAIASTQQEAAP